ncbi:hypothetical protein [Desulfopila sp. IMCC35008]|uniref:hypothetical protein n=1 Tax=Desulfopila sp. IMCC35008 TaxID=2653858 RepID=UPI0013D7560C|nr:hypothetical protein [Desulfopila sp. IMCC35008]
MAMKNIDAGVIKELVYGGLVAAVCFGAPVLMEYLFPEPTVLHDFVDHTPYLGCLIIGLTIVRLVQRKKHLEEDV